MAHPDGIRVRAHIGAQLKLVGTITEAIGKIAHVGAAVARIDTARGRKAHDRAQVGKVLRWTIREPEHGVDRRRAWVAWQRRVDLEIGGEHARGVWDETAEPSRASRGNRVARTF